MSKHHDKPAGLPIINGKATAIDIGSRFHVAAVSADLCDEPVQTFQAFTSDLERMADWFVLLGIKTVAMESTGVYWISATRFSKTEELKSSSPMRANLEWSPAWHADYPGDRPG